MPKWLLHLLNLIRLSSSGIHNRKFFAAITAGHSVCNIKTSMVTNKKLHSEFIENIILCPTTVEIQPGDCIGGVPKAGFIQRFNRGPNQMLFRTLSNLSKHTNRIFLTFTSPSFLGAMQQPANTNSVIHSHLFHYVESNPNYGAKMGLKMVRLIILQLMEFNDLSPTAILCV